MRGVRSSGTTWAWLTCLACACARAPEARVVPAAGGPAPSAAAPPAAWIVAPPTAPAAPAREATGDVDAAPASAPAPPHGRCAASDCAACASQPGCAWCGYPHGCLSTDERSSCAESNAWIARAAWCHAVARGPGAAGLTPVGPPRAGRLETLTQLAWPVRRGLCYALVVRLAPGAALDMSRPFGRLRDAAVDTDGPVTIVFGATPPPLGEPACPRGPGTFELKVKDVHDNFVSPLRGHGAFEAQLYARPIVEAVLHGREREADEGYRRGMCRACRQDYAACFFRGDTGCDSELDECLRLNGLAPDQCR